MLLEEFEKRTNIFIPGEYFNVIHQFYMDTEMDKDRFCRAYKNNTGNLAIKVKMAYVEKRTREQVAVCRRLEMEEKKWQNTVKELRSEIAQLTKKLEREQEWKPYGDVSGRVYEDISNKGVPPASDEEAVRFVSTHFGFDMTKISIKRIKPLYEINRHQQMRQAGVTVRNPYIFASGCNYVYFSSMGVDYEILNGKIIPL